jgi:hypothetical protein
VVACDFLTLETVFLKTLYVLFFIELSTRRSTSRVRPVGPTRPWVTQQARNLAITGCLDDKHILLRDRDAKFSGGFDEVLRTEGLAVVKTPIRAPKANALAERWVGSRRREGLDHVLVFGRRHLQRVLAAYVEHYNRARPHRGLDLQPPDPGLDSGAMPGTKVRRRDVLGGLIHETIGARHDPCRRSWSPTGTTVWNAAEVGGWFGRATGSSTRHVRPPSRVASRLLCPRSRTWIQAWRGSTASIEIARAPVGMATGCHVSPASSVRRR